MGAFEIGYGAALLAGLLSFVSPCVLPLVPAYLCFVGGVSLDQLTDEQARAAQTGRIVALTAVFALGFITVFVILGATATALSRLVTAHYRELGMVAGTLIALFGLHEMGVLRLALLNREARFHPRALPSGALGRHAGAYVLGLAFAFGWTPCVGPVLAAILMVAATGDSLSQGMGLLGVYGLGLGLPFVLAAAAARPFLRLMARLGPHLGLAKLAMGALLVLTGALIFAGSLSGVAQWLLDAVPGLNRLG